ncbi:MAG: hypothetical protein CL850_00705 [Crocinitomicaceae bacterium]|nr:hypothetical protein [Crocinitomicaceae bacterium]|tara:strand:+ start:2389 stop:2766 length:378 start_codon:yes stop_codon:yes gene_type:complete
MKKQTRKALDCKLIGQSDIDSKYFKYEVTIQEADGSVYKAPAFGRDMQDALNRLVWNERTEAVSKFANQRPWMQVVPLLSLFCVLGIFAIQSKTHDNPIWILAGLASLGVILGMSVLWSNHLEKH